MSHQHGAQGIALLAALALAVGYTFLAVLASRPWSGWRTASFLTGSVLLMVALAPGQDATFTAHMRQHLLIGMLAPTALVLGAPVTLLLRTLPATAGRRLGGFTRTRPIRLLTHPLTALGLAVGPLPVLYLTPLYAHLATDGAWHALLQLHFLLAGYLFAWVIAGPDSAPRRASVPFRLVVLGVAVAVHATLSQALYAGLVDIPLPTADRQAGATVMYYGGDIAELLLAVALVTGWRPPRHRRPNTPSPGQRCTERMAVASLSEMVPGRRRWPFPTPARRDHVQSVGS